MILGIDEVGRGCWAGPLVVAAVVLGGVEIKGLTDSKALSRKRREQLYDEIMSKAGGIGLGWVKAGEIDQIGLSAALRLATKRAVESVETSFHEIVIDGTVNFLSGTPLEKYVTTMTKADLLVPSVSAASIVAKVARDRYMAEVNDRFPGYGFANHVGYGTTEHRLAIEKLGACSEHRLSFDPLAKYRQADSTKNAEPKLRDAESTTMIGRHSESVIAEELSRRGHDIIERNWKSRYCEIDIVSRNQGIYYFTEVKHRQNNRTGSGSEVITRDKLKQMEYAARLYAHVKKLGDVDMRLMVASTSGKDYDISDIIELS